MGVSQVDKKDVAIVGSLGFLMFDVFCTQHGFSGCPKPIHKWLIGSYGILCASRIMMVLGAIMSNPESGHVLLNLRQKSTVLKTLVTMTWWVVAPAFACWSLLGASWSYQVLSQAPQCMPSSMHVIFLAIWQGLSVLWVVQYVGMGVSAFLYERELRRAEVDLREIEDEDSQRRWGAVGDSREGLTALPATMAGGGLTPSEIKALGGLAPRTEGEVEASPDEDCPICLNGLCLGESCRRLASCGHVFHRSCVDLWLLRSTDCPLCKQKAAPAKPIFAAAPAVEAAFLLAR